jgi:hypothetical protein
MKIIFYLLEIALHILRIKLTNHKINVSILLALCPIIVLVGVVTLTWMKHGRNYFRILQVTIML